MAIALFPWSEGIAWAAPEGPVASRPANPSLPPPLPPPRPTAPPPAAVGRERPLPQGTATSPPSVRAPDENACIGRLAGLGVKFESRPPIEDGGCGGTEIVFVEKLPGDVAVAPPSMMTCPLAESLARWMKEHVAVEASNHLQSNPTKITIGTSYQCRNQRSGTKMSEHAFANAVDVMGFELSARRTFSITFQADGTPEAAFQAAIRAAACPLFSTVLGPGSDADHSNHFHLDLRGRNGGYRLCQ